MKSIKDTSSDKMGILLGTSHYIPIWPHRFVVTVF